MDISDRLKELREEKGLSQKALAEIAGLSIGTIQGYEQRKYKPKAETIRKISAALNVPPFRLDPESFPYPGEKIKELRLSKGLSQEQFASMLSVSVDAVDQWEKGLQTISQYNFEKILGVFRVKSTDLLDDRLLPYVSIQWLHPEGIPDNYDRVQFPDNMLYGYDLFSPDMSLPEDQKYFIIRYPDENILKAPEKEYSTFLHEAALYIKFLLDQLRQKYENK